MAQNEAGITVKKSEDIVEWYGQVVTKSEMADYSKVKGCPVIRPLGMAAWEAVQEYFNKIIKGLGVKNAYFPLFIPESFFKKEASHIEGFAPELAWIDVGDSEERLAVRPTSETAMYDSYSRWIRSHRDLPLKLNQWCNVVRWEVSDVKLFLRGREFLWQEGHNAFATKKEAEDDAMLMIAKYKQVSEDLLALPAFIGLKSKGETFPGAEYTYTIEGFMPDGKALQAGTSHFLGDGFAKAFDVKYRGEDEEMHYVWQTSWGISTRLLGGMIMTHSDDKGLVLPPKVAPTKAVIIPITIKNKPELSTQVKDACESLYKQLKDAGLVVELDDRDNYSPGFKYAEHELKGVPLRIEIGPRDIEDSQCMIVRRDTGVKQAVPLDNVSTFITKELEAMHNDMLNKASKAVEEKTVFAKTYDELKQGLADKKLVIAHHCGEEESEKQIKADTQGTTRCRILGEDTPDEGAICVHTGKPAKYKIIFAKNY